jgi:hypothetical protein
MVKGKRSQVAAVSHGGFKTPRHTPFDDYYRSLNRAMMVCLALMLLGMLVTTSVAMIAHLVLINSHA